MQIDRTGKRTVQAIVQNGLKHSSLEHSIFRAPRSGELRILILLDLPSRGFRLGNKRRPWLGAHLCSTSGEISVLAGRPARRTQRRRAPGLAVARQRDRHGRWDSAFAGGGFKSGDVVSEDLPEVGSAVAVRHVRRE